MLGVPRLEGGAGFPFQVLATRTSWLRAFHCNPSRMGLLVAAEYILFQRLLT